MSDGIPTLLSGLDREQWRLLSVLACERKLTLSALEKLGVSTEMRQWLLDSVGQGLLIDAGIAYGLPYTRSLAGERSMSIVPACRPSVLRRVCVAAQLSTTVADARAIMGDNHLAGFTTALYGGDLAALEHEAQGLMRRSSRGEEASLIRARLFEAVCCPFDPDFVLGVWGDGAWRLVEQVLADARATLDPIEELYRWAIGKADERTSSKLLRLLAEHAFLRGDIESLSRLMTCLPGAEQEPLRIARYVLSDELSHAESALSALVGGKLSQHLAVPWPPGICALLALLALGREPVESAIMVRRLLQRLASPDSPSIAGWPTPQIQGPVVKAIRSLVRRMTQPDSERLRLSAHHQPADAPAWETLFTAVAVRLENYDAVTRLGWTNRLAADGKRWGDAGYGWIARQALHLGKTLSPNVTAGIEELTPCRGGELLVANFLEREPDWRRALTALERFAETVERSEITLSRRVAWFVDMTSGELAKPALEEYRDGAGWTRGQRVPFDELRAIRHTLPPEDVAVLVALDAAPHLGRLPPEGIDALCGHPRVFNGARGRQTVEVVRRPCRLETVEERGHLVIQIAPPGMGEGLNVVVESESRVVVYRVDGSLAKLVRLLPSGIHVPVNRQAEALVILARLAEHVEVHSPQLGAHRALVAESNPCIRISPVAGAWWIEVGVRPFGEHGRFFPPGLGRTSVALHSGDEVFDTERHLDAEIAQFRKLLSQCPTLQGALELEAETAAESAQQLYSVSLGEEELLALLVELKAMVPPCSLEWKNSRPIASLGKVTSASLQGSLRRVKGWYLVNGQVNLKDVTPLALGDLLRLPFTRSGRFVRLPTGDFLEVERRIHQVLSKLRSVAQVPARASAAELKLPEAAYDVLRNLVAAASELRVDSEAAASFERIDESLSSEPKLPEFLEAIMRPYQLEGARWLLRYSQLGFGVCLADDMGLGKTIQVIALLVARAEDGPALVIAPTSVCSNWLEELSRFAPSLRAVEYTGRSRSALLESLQGASGVPVPHVLIASYALLQQDADALTAIEWNTAVLDEAQFIKNPHSLRAKAAFKLSARHRVVMTGTPVENHLGDLWSIFHFLNPTLLGSFKHFQLCYLKPIERDRDSDQQALLKQLVQPFLLRRLKNDVLQELPPITTVCHHVRLSKDESLRYALLRRQIHDKLYTSYGKRDHKLQVLAEITKLRRFCCHPRLIFPDAPSESSKMEAFLEIVDELRANGHRALVFSQFVDFLDLVREQLDERGHEYLYLDGSTPKDTRHARVREFQTGNAGLFLISLKAGGFGLNLTAADYVIHLDPWWNPAVEAQATDRAHRIGQERPVTVYRLVTKDSIEERIVELHEEKRAIADALLLDSAMASPLDTQELLELLRLN